MRLHDEPDLPPASRAALRAARAELTRLLELPSEFYAVVEGGDEMVLVELWHSPGNALDTCLRDLPPTEKNRVLVYDSRAQRIVSTSFRPARQD